MQYGLKTHTSVFYKINNLVNILNDFRFLKLQNKPPQALLWSNSLNKFFDQIQNLFDSISNNFLTHPGKVLKVQLLPPEKYRILLELSQFRHLPSRTFRIWSIRIPGSLLDPKWSRADPSLYQASPFFTKKNLKFTEFKLGAQFDLGNETGRWITKGSPAQQTTRAHWRIFETWLMTFPRPWENSLHNSHNLSRVENLAYFPIFYIKNKIFCAY